MTAKMGRDEYAEFLLIPLSSIASRIGLMAFILFRNLASASKPNVPVIRSPISFAIFRAFLSSMFRRSECRLSARAMASLSPKSRLSCFCRSLTANSFSTFLTPINLHSFITFASAEKAAFDVSSIM